MTPKAPEWVLYSGCMNHMTGDRNLLTNAPLTLSPLKHITYADKGKSKVLGLGKVAISKDKHMDKVMLVESLGFNLMSAQCFVILIWLLSLANIITLC